MFRSSSHKSDPALASANRVYDQARELRASSRLREAVAVLARDGDFTDERLDSVLLWVLRISERNDELQAALMASIERCLNGLRIVSESYAAQLIRFSQFACVGSTPTDKLLRAMKSLTEIHPGLEIPLAAARRRARQQLQRSDITLVSLGLNCVPWLILNRWGFRSPSAFVHEFNPFSMAIHTVEGVVEALATDFSTYFSNDEVFPIRSTNGHPMMARKDRSAVWNHNAEEYWLRDDCLELRNNLAGKIANFRSSCRQEIPVFVLADYPTQYPADAFQFLAPLKAALRQYTGHDADYLILTSHRRVPDKGILHCVDETTFFFRCPQPNQKYVWWEPDCVDSPSGLAYEEEYMSLIRSCLERWNLLAAGQA